MLYSGWGDELLPVTGHLGDREPIMKPTSTEVGFCFEEGRQKMSQICNFFSLFFYDFSRPGNVHFYNSRYERVGERSRDKEFSEKMSKMAGDYAVISD